jgi:PPOX class probable F420-dependent enzyme
VAAIPDSIRTFLKTGPLAHVVTLGAGAEPHISLAWVGEEDGELVLGTLNDQPKLRNLRADPRIAMSFEAPGKNSIGLNHYLVVRGHARITQGGAPELLQRLAEVYIGPGVRFPPMPQPPAGFVVRMTVERISGSGPWVEATK